MNAEINLEERNRTIRWSTKIDALAVRLASEQGYVQTEGGVSKFLADLVLFEVSGKRPSDSQARIAQIDEEFAKIKHRYSTKKAKKTNQD